MRRVLYVSGTRADYGPARALLKAIAADKQLELSLVVTGMHLDVLHGETWREIEADGLAIADRVYGRVGGDSLTPMAASVGLYLFGLTHVMSRLKPEVVLVLGDRGEMLAAAIAAISLNAVLVHLCGGSVSGSVDDSIRHAITKLAHYHLVSCDEHARRVIQMGESPASVQVIGLPGGDIAPDVVFSREQICVEYSLPIDLPYVLVIQHAVTHSCEHARHQMLETLEAVLASGYPALLANPNDDAGGREILRAMLEYAERHPALRILPPPRSRERFASIMAHAGVLVGNSSCGTVEAMSVGLPVVNIGERQTGREATSCMLNVEHDRTAIARAISEALGDGPYRTRLAEFTSGLVAQDTTRLVIDCLRSLDLSAGSRHKVFSDLCPRTELQPPV